MKVRTASSALGQARLRQIVQGVAASEHEWLSLVRYDLGRRWYHRLTSDDDHEVWLLSWLPGQRTGFHDHGESSGAFTVARGTLRERTAPATARARRAGAQGPGEIVRPLVHPRCDQCLSAARGERARLLAAADSMRRFEFGPGGLERVTTETAVRW
jgi:Cysteine dioxygenase type I.